MSIIQNLMKIANFLNKKLYLYICSISNEDFTPFDNDNKEWTADLEITHLLV